MLKIRYLLIIVLLCATEMDAHDPGMHVYIGSKTFDIWRNYDRDFYNALMLPDTNIRGMEVRKFYYIGLTLPDLLLDTQQRAVRALLDTLHSVRVDIRRWYGSVQISLDGPLSITDRAYENIQTPITYAPGELPMNSNFEKVCQMVLYARGRNWAPEFKALIYGCYMHLIQDLFSGMVLVPSRFGYGYAIDSDSALSKQIPLAYGELYYEIFSGTHLTEFEWQQCIEKGLYRARRYENGKVAEIGGYFDFYPILREYDISGRRGLAHEYGWQQIDFSYVDSFVKAMNSVFCINNLTRERLESYLHGWAILLFTVYGYRRDEYRNKDFGGLMGHPNWRPAEIANFWDDIGDDFFRVEITPAWFIDLIGFICFPIPYSFIRACIIGGLTLPWPSGNMPYSVLRGISRQWEWHTYWETPGGLEILWNAVPQNQRTPDLEQEYGRAHRNLLFWDRFAEVKEPNLQASYDQEKTVSVNISNLYRDAMEGGSRYIGGVDVFILSRKAGLTGGMYRVPSENYGRQPGILFMGFKKGNDTVWSNINVYRYSDRQDVKLIYDLILFGKTKVLIKGKTSTGEIRRWEKQYLQIEPIRCRDSIVLSELELANANVCTLWFEIENAGNTDDYTIMFSSKYDSAYNAREEIYNNRLYQEWFNQGNPTREQSENPFTNPLQYWPYALRATVVDSCYLNPPTGLSGRLDSTFQKIILSWQDNSAIEMGYAIFKSVNNGPNTKIILPAGSTNYEDWDIAIGPYTYRYFVQAFRVLGQDTFYSDMSNGIAVNAFGSSFSGMTAFNNTQRLAYGGGKLHLAFTGNFGDKTCIYYTSSNDGGTTWSDLVLLDSSLDAKYPTIGISSTGYPHIFWVKKVQDYTGNGLNAYFFYAGSNPSIRVFPICRSATPISEPQPPALFIRGDTFHSVVVNYDLDPADENIVASELYYNTWLWSGSEYQPLNSYRFRFSQDTLRLPSLLIDRGRVIIAYIARGAVRFKYKDASSQNWDSTKVEPLPPAEIKNYSISGSRDLLFLKGNWAWNRIYRGEWRNTSYFWSQEIDSVGGDYCEGSIPHSPVVIGTYLIRNGNQLNLIRAGWIKLLKRENTNGGIRWMEKGLIAKRPYKVILYPQFCVRNERGFTYLHIVFTIGDTSPSPPYHRPPYLIACTTLVFSPSIGEPIPNCDKVTFPNQGELLVIEPGTGNLHAVYNIGTTIAYAKSTDRGETWEPVMEVDSGSYPSLVLDNSGMPRITYLKNDTVFCKTLNTDNTWHKTILFAGRENLKPGPPVIASPYPKEFSDYAYSAFPVKDSSQNISKIYFSFFDVNEDIGPEPKEIASGEKINSISIAVTPSDIIHLAWEEDGEIYYRFSKGKDSTGELVWSDIYNISESPDVISENPVISAYGENVICAWKEGEPGEIYRRVRKLSSPTMAGNDWSGIENISQSPDKESDYPVLSTLDVCAYQERVDSLNYEIFAWIKGERINLSETENSSKYPHIAVEPPTVSDASGTIIIEPKIIIDAIWTEKLSDSLYYEVRFKRYEYNPSSPPTEYISVAIGESIPSPYCEQRDGVIDYGEFSCDYSSSSLIYNLPYFNPNSTYLLFAVVYKEAPQTWREEIYLDSNFITEVFYYPYLPETLNIILPKESYENDLAIRKEIERILGNYALIAELKVFEVSLPESLQGGGQSLRNRMVLRPVLYQNRPNPFKNLTNISFAIPKESYVSLIIYDASGRKVRSLIRERLKAGSYNQKWDGRDDGGKEMPQGVYFYQLKTQNFKEIKKAVLLR